MLLQTQVRPLTRMGTKRIPRKSLTSTRRSSPTNQIVHSVVIPTSPEDKMSLLRNMQSGSKGISQVSRTAARTVPVEQKGHGAIPQSVPILSPSSAEGKHTVKTRSELPVLRTKHVAPCVRSGKAAGDELVGDGSSQILPISCRLTADDAIVLLPGSWLHHVQGWTRPGQQRLPVMGRPEQNGGLNLSKMNLDNVKEANDMQKYGNCMEQGTKHEQGVKVMGRNGKWLRV